MKPPLGLLIIYRIIAVLLFLIAVPTFFVSLYKFYFAISYLPFVFLSFAFFGFLFAYGFWRYRRWLIIPLGLNLLSVISINLQKLFYVWNFSQKGIITALISICLAVGILVLVWFTRRFLTGKYVQPKILTVYIIFWLISLLNYSSFIKNFLECCR